jgi:predicted RNase H-like HicB family nuclease
VAKVTFNVTVHEEDDGSFWAEVAELPGCFASGFSIDEVKEALYEAMTLWLPEGVELGEAKWAPLEESKPVRTRPSARTARPNKRLRKTVITA